MAPSSATRRLRNGRPTPGHSSTARGRTLFPAVPAGYRSSTTTSINDSGLIPGTGRDAAGSVHALLWRVDRLDRVEDLGNGDGDLGLGSLTPAGEAVGNTYSGEPPSVRAVPLTWSATAGLRRLPTRQGTPGVLRAVQPVSRGTGVGAIGVSSRGTIIGIGPDGATGRNFTGIWPRPTSAPLTLPLPAGQAGAWAATITETGIVAGETSASHYGRATIWSCSY